MRVPARYVTGAKCFPAKVTTHLLLCFLVSSLYRLKNLNHLRAQCNRDVDMIFRRVCHGIDDLVISDVQRAFQDTYKPNLGEIEREKQGEGLTLTSKCSHPMLSRTVIISHCASMCHFPSSPVRLRPKNSPCSLSLRQAQ